MRLLCDEMLNRLARWLRAAGYDTALAREGGTDRELMRRAVADDRLLITRDREFLQRREAGRRVLLLRSEALTAQALELRERLGIDWLHHPFSRCLLCNGVLEPLRAPAEPLPESARFCPRCRKIYWEGSHVRRMRARLRAWRDGFQTSSAPP